MFNLFFLLLSISQAVFAYSSDILLAPGEKQSINSSDSLWIENRKIVRATEHAGGFYLIGAKPGQSQIRAGKHYSQVTVLDPSQHQTYRELKKQLTKTLNLSLKIQNGEVLVHGRLVRIQDWEQLLDSCRVFSCRYQMGVTVSDKLQAEIQDYFSKKLLEQGLPQQRIFFSNPLSVQVASSEFSNEVADFFKNYGIKVIKLKSSMEMAPLVRVQITIAEIKKDETLKYGISWPASYSAQVLPEYLGTNQTAMVSLNMLEQNGLGKILASPNLLCKSGKEAEFVAGGEFPIKIMNYKMQDVVWKRYGIVLKVKPVADFSGRMSISIETEVSSIDDSNKVDGIPGLFTNKVQSHFDLAESRVIALSGLIKSEQSKASQGIPGLGKIPILGSLFASKEFRENRTELVIFVKPEIIHPGSQGL